MKTEALILKERAQAQQYLDVAGVMIAVLDKTGKINLINKKGCQILGYDENKILHQNWFDLCIHDDVREDIVGVFNKLMTGNIESVEYFENPIITKSGEQKIIAFHNTLIMDDDSNITGILFSGEDITERKHAEEALWESEARIRALLNAPTDAMILIDSAGIVLAVNNIHAEWLKKSIDEMIGKCVFDFFPSEIAEFRKAQTNEVFNTGKQIHFEESQNGKIFNTNVYPVFGAKGKVTAVAVYIQDITERKQAEEALRQSERDLKFRNQINSIFLSYPDEEMYAEILKLIRKAMESKYGTFGYFDENGYFVAPAVTRKIYWDKCNVPDKNIIFKKGTFGGIWGRAIKERKALISNDGPFNTPKGHIHIENTMVTPIIFHEEVISAIHLANKPNGYDEQDRTVLETIADQIAPVLYARLQRDRKDMQRKQAENMLQRSEALLNATQQLSKVGGWEWNVETQTMFWTDEVYRIHDFQPSEFTPGSIEHIERSIECYDPEDRPVIMEAFRNCAENGQAYDLEFPFTTSMGRQRWIRTVANPVLKDKRVVKVVGNMMDITERKQAEDALRESEAMMKSIFRAAPTGIGVVLNRNIQFVNQTFIEMLGYSKEELIGQNSRMVYPSNEEFDRVGKYKYEQIRKYGTGTIETQLLRKDGRLIDVLLSSTPIDLNDLSKGVTFTATDITERKRAEEEIRLHAAMMDNVAEGVYLIGLDDLLIKWTNEKFTRMFGYDPGEMVGKQVDIVNAPTEMTPTESRTSIVNVLKETGEWHGEVRNIKRDGTHFWCYANASLFDHPEYGMVIVSAHTDITERKKLEDELARSEKQMSAAIEAARGFTFSYDIATGKINWGGAIEKVTGYTLEEFAQVDIDGWAERIHPDDRDEVLSIMDEAINKKDRATAEYRFKTKKGGYVILSSISRTEKENGKPVRLVGILQDITERKQDEEKLKASEDKYSTLVEKGNDGIIIIQDFVLKFVNSRMTELTGFTKEEAIGKPFYDYVSSEYKEMLKERVKKRLKGEAVPGKYEIDILSKDGSTIPVEINASLIEYEGRPADMAIIRDITERLQTEKELQERINELETFYRTTLGREERVIELKQEVNQLLEQLGKNNKYRDYS